MTLGEKVGLVMIAFSIFEFVQFPDLAVPLWIIFLIGEFVFLLNGKHNEGEDE